MALRQSKPKGPIPAEVFEKVVIPNATEFIRQSVLGRLAGKESSNANVAEAFTKMLETRVVAGEHKSQWVLLHL
ncbi:MAG: hypothetical protein FJY77_05770, partial [Candidatus Altiarchaeales archaeon]|nr:hypothetical protein [Candidatus Altiarchaeales archaeon]